MRGQAAATTFRVAVTGLLILSTACAPAPNIPHEQVTQADMLARSECVVREVQKAVAAPDALHDSAWRIGTVAMGRCSNTVQSKMLRAGWRNLNTAITDVGFDKINTEAWAESMARDGLEKRRTEQ